MRRITAVFFAFALAALAFLPTTVSAAVGGCAGGEDYNGDGFADLAIGVMGEVIGAENDAGAVQVIYGGPGGVSSAGDQVFHQNSDGMNDTAEGGDAFGSALASGDFDGDGFDDVAVGVPDEDIGSVVNAGAIHTIYGSAAGLTSAGDQVFHRGTIDIAGDAGEFDHFGSALAACDFDGDGRDDLAVGVPFDDVSSESNAGGVNVLYGGAGGLSAAGDQLFHQDVLNDDAEAFDFFGVSLAAGDFNADGRGDLAVGVPAEDLESVPVSQAGAVHVLYGGASGLSATGNQVFHQDSPGMNDTAEDFDIFGWAVTSGDFNGDGFDDLTIGVPFEGIGAITDAGAIQTIYGGSGGLSTSGDQVFHQESADMNDTSEEDDNFGRSLSSGDFDGDGFDDVAVGVPFEGIGTVANAGAVQIVYGTSAGLSSAGNQVFHQDTPGMNDTAEPSDRFARTVTSGDLNGDGFDDLTNGVPAEDVGVANAGEVQVIYGMSEGLSTAGDQVFHQNTDGMNDTAEAGDLFGGALVLSPFNDLFFAS